MKIVFAIAMCLIAAASHAAMVAPLLEFEYADTEVATNFPLRVDFARLQKLHVALELDDSAADGLEVLLGCDADGNGSLSASEASLVFGYDCGTWFARKTESDQVDIEPSSTNDGTARRELAIGWRQLSPDWDLVRVTRRGEGRVNESVSLTIENKKFAVIFK